MKTGVIRILNHLFLGVVVLLGLNSRVAAQYGAPSAKFKISGSVKAEECFTGIRNIKVTLQSESDAPVIKTVYTDENGNFSLYIPEDLLWYKWKIRAEDIDGVMNSGQFLGTEENINLHAKNINYSSYPRVGETDPLEIILQYEGINPCKQLVIPPYDNITGITSNEGKEVDLPISGMPIYLQVTDKFEPLHPKEISTPQVPLNGGSIYELPASDTDSYPTLDSLNNIDLGKPPGGVELTTLDNIKAKVKVYPNPTSGTVTFEMFFPGDEDIYIYVYTSVGQLLYIDRCTKITGTYTKEMDMTELPRGIYTFRMFNGTKSVTKRVVKI